MPRIIVDPHLCNRCNICSAVCILRLIEKTDGAGVPVIKEENEKVCFACGHCEAFCPQKALTLEFRLEEKKSAVYGDGNIDPLSLSTYIKQRRSIRRYSSQPVPREIISKVIEVARYAPSGGNSQTVRWIVFQNPEEVRKIAGLTIEWMRTLPGTSHPMANYVLPMIFAWDRGTDSICRNAPHLVIAHSPCSGSVFDPTDAIIALTHFDIAAPSFGLGACWAGFVKMAADEYKPLQDLLALPEGRRMAYAIMFGYPSYKPVSIPRRNPVRVSWR